MVYYIVKLEIDPSIKQEFRQWLPEHVKEVLTIEGFNNAEILEVLENNLPLENQLIVKYEVQTIEELQNYLLNYAPILQNKTLVKFGKNVRANREILRVFSTFN